jgi:adenine deaminase
MCSDDLHPSDILEKGHMDNNINLAIKAGIKPIYAILMATKNIADCYKLKNIGAIAPGFKADFVMFKDLKDIKVEHVYKAGDLVASNYQPLFESKQQINKDILDTVNIDIFKIDLSFVMKSDLANVIGLVRNNITTKHLVKRVKLIDNEFQSSSNPGLLKLCVIERHTSSNNIGKGIISDFGLKNGALALTVAHDSHNLIVVGDNDQDMMHAIKKIKEIGGGVVVISNGLCVNYLPLEVAGLMSDKSPEFVAKKLKDIDKLLRSMGVGEEIADPLLQLAFMSLPVIPEIKVTDKGLFDVSNFRIISLEVE